MSAPFASTGFRIITADERLAERRGIKGVLTGISGIGKTSQLWTLDAGPGGVPKQIKALPAKFDASRDVVEQFEAMSTDGRYETMPKKEVAKAEKEKRKLLKNLEGIRHMGRLPDALFVVDTRKEQIAVDEARKLKIPLIGLVDTNCDPDQIDYVIPGNDDALRSVKLFVSRIADAVIDGRGQRESAMAEQVTSEAEAAAAREASRTVRPADINKPQRPAETPAPTA